jgi:hypothetical protein
LAWLLLAHQVSMFSSNMARPYWVTPLPGVLEGLLQWHTLARSL